MANKKVKVSECCIITKDDKGQMSLVGKSKEALTTLQKNKIDVYIALESTPKDDAEAFFKENNVPYKAIVTKEDDGKEKYDAVVLSEGNILLYRNDWTWTVEGIVDKLYRKSEQPAQKTEQKKMEESFDEYKRWANEANKRNSKNIIG